MHEWIKGLFSLEERKASTIMISFLSFVIVAIYLLFKNHTIDMPLVYLILGLGGYVCGYNVIPQMFNNNSYGYGLNSYSSYNCSTTPSTMTTNSQSINSTTNNEINSGV